MQKYLLKILIIICLFSLTSLNLLMVYAEPEANTETPTEEQVTEEAPTEDTVTSEETPPEGEISEETSDDSDIHTDETASSAAGQQVQSSSTDTITGIKTINGLPEANLELNNILNIILIAIGVLLILLAIALLIRIGK